MSAVFLFLAAFLASAIEMVEALTIVLAVGVTRGWRSALAGVGAATVMLAVIIAVPRADAAFGCRSMRSVSWSASCCSRVRAAVAAQGDSPSERFQGAPRRGRDLLAGTRGGRPRGPRRAPGPRLVLVRPLLKGVLLEGLEVAFIVITFGSTQGDVPLAAAAAGAALVARGCRRRRRPGASQPGTREHVEVRGRDHADHVRDFWGRRGNRGVVARRRACAPRDPRLSSPSRRWRSCVCFGGSTHGCFHLVRTDEAGQGVRPFLVGVRRRRRLADRGRTRRRTGAVPRCSCTKASPPGGSSRSPCSASSPSRSAEPRATPADPARLRSLAVLCRCARPRRRRRFIRSRLRSGRDPVVARRLGVLLGVPAHEQHCGDRHRQHRVAKEEQESGPRVEIVSPV